MSQPKFKVGTAKEECQFRVGDVVYGFAFFHKKWVYCKVADVQESRSRLWGNSLQGNDFYAIDFETIIPEELVDSPLMKALK